LDIPSKTEGRDGVEERVPDEQADDPPDVRPSASTGSFFSRLRKNSIPLSFTHGLRSRKGSDEEPDYASDSSSESDEESMWPQDYVSHTSLRGSIVAEQEDEDI
jgi:hypothetical protein